MKVNWKASAPVIVLFGIAAAGQQLANSLQYTLGMSTAMELGCFCFLIGCIATLKTGEVIRRRYPEDPP